MNLLALSATRSGQTTVDLTLMLKDVEMSPDQFFRVVVTEDFCLIVWTSIPLPELCRLGNLQDDQTGFRIKAAGAHLPLGA